MRSRSLPRALIAPSLMVVVACGGGSEGDTGGDVAAVVPAQTITVATQSFTETIGAIGMVTPRSGHVAALSAPVQARIARALVATGQHVQAGQPLVVFDEAPLQAALHSAQAAVTAAQQAYNRTSRLANEGIAPRKDVESASADLARARADLVSAQRHASLGTLRSPIAGVVTRMTAALGAMADPAQSLVEVADPSAVDILLGATPANAAHMRPGARVTISAAQSTSSEALGIGSVVDVGGTVDTATRSVTVRVRAPTTRRPLRIGETVFGRVVVSTHPAAVVVPNEALVPAGDGYQVFVVDASGMAHARAVSVGGRTGQLTEITDGLSAGERIVTNGAYGVQDSAKVVPLRQGTAAGASREAP